MKRRPTTKAEWQSAVDSAHACLALDAARKYGLVTGGPHVRVRRCEEILNWGAKRGVTPKPDAIERLIRELAA